MKKSQMKLSFLASLLMSSSLYAGTTVCSGFTGYICTKGHSGNIMDVTNSSYKTVSYIDGWLKHESGGTRTENSNADLYVGSAGTITSFINSDGASLVNYGTAKISLEDNSGKLEVSDSTKFNTDGSITFKSGSKLFVDVASSANGYYDGQKINNVINAMGFLTIEDDKLIIEDNSALLEFDYSILIDRNLSLTVTQSQTVQNTISSDNKNAGKAAVILQNVIDSNTPQMQGVVNRLQSLSTDKQVADAVDSTTPQTTTSSFTASNQISNNVSNIVSQRQNVNLNGAGLNSGDAMLSEKNVWVKPYGSMGSQDDKDGVNGFDIDTYGIGVGFDGEYKENHQIGVGLFYTKADVDVNNVSQSSDIDVYSLIVYGNIPVIDAKTNLMYQVGYSWQDTSSSRDIDFMGTSAKADYTSKVATIDLKLLRDYQINENLMLQPFVSTTYRHFTSPSYSESGADALNLEVNRFSSSEFIVGLGTLAYLKIDDDFQLFGNANVGYDVKDDNNIVSSSYEGASGLSFDTEGLDNGRWSYDLGVGVESNVTELSDISFSYNLQGEGSDYMNHVISAKYTFSF